MKKSKYVKNWIYKFDYNPSYLKKKTFAKFGPSYRVHFDQTEKEKTNKQKFQKWF